MRSNRWEAEIRPRRLRSERGSAVVDFVLVLVVLIPLVLGILQLAIVLHVRNTLTAAATEGARHGAVLDRGPEDGAAYTRQQIGNVIADRFAKDVGARQTLVDGTERIAVTGYAEGPPLGLGGPEGRHEAGGHEIGDEDH